MRKPQGTPASLALLASAAVARKDFGEFNVHVDPFYKSARHTKLMVQYLEALERRDIEKLAIFMPPRHGKTLHASERFPAWFLGRHPRAQVILASYTSDRASASSRKSRELLKSERWPFADVKLDPTSTAVDEWRTSEGGILKATGVGGSMTGYGADLLSIDDPIKDRAEANSESRRNAIWDWYTEVALTRLMPGGRELMMLTRWHEDDLAGRVLNSESANRWEVLQMPALSICPICEVDHPSTEVFLGECKFEHDARDIIGRLPGDELWPESGLEIPRPGISPISTRAFLSLYQQRPTVEDGELFKRAWFARRWEQLPTMRKVVMWIDGAWKDGVQNDYSAIAVWGLSDSDYYLIDAWRGRVEYPDLKMKVLDFYRSLYSIVGFPPVLCVEDAASGTPLVQELRRSTSIPIVAVPAKGSKFSRAEATTPVFEANKAILPADADWVDAWIDEHVKFPGAKHDDYVDTTSGAINRLGIPTTNWSFAIARN